MIFIYNIFYNFVKSDFIFYSVDGRRNKLQQNFSISYVIQGCYCT